MLLINCFNLSNRSVIAFSTQALRSLYIATVNKGGGKKYLHLRNERPTYVPDVEKNTMDYLVRNKKRLYSVQCAAAMTNGLQRNNILNYSHPNRNQSLFKVRGFSSSSESTPDESQLSLYQRFKIAYKQHGKTLIAVHVATSILWYGGFMYAIHSGVDVVHWLEQLGASETILSPFKKAGIGEFAVAYLMYKLATPARYTVTLGGTNLAIRYLKNKGHIQEVRDEDKISSLMKESKEAFIEKTEKDWSKVKDKMKQQ